MECLKLGENLVYPFGILFSRFPLDKKMVLKPAIKAKTLNSDLFRGWRPESQWSEDLEHGPSFD